jgi:hypothetical protein
MVEMWKYINKKINSLPEMDGSCIYYSRWRDGQDVAEWKSLTWKGGYVLVAAVSQLISSVGATFEYKTIPTGS